jgi:flagellin-specific chaperone FliS
MTECTQSSFEFAAHFSRPVVADFTGPTTTSDGGALLLRQTAAKLNLLPRLAACFRDSRDQRYVQHTVEEMLAQRVYGLALGYEDLNDHDHWRHDPLLGVLTGKPQPQQPLAGKSTLNRLELGTAEANRYKKIDSDTAAIDCLLVDLFLEAHAAPPARIVLDLDATDLPLHGHQEQRFFHGYYDGYCYLPLYVFCGEHLLCARLRPANQDAAAGSVEEVQRMVEQIRQAWPKVQVILRGDSGFCREGLMAWCEANKVDFVFGFARNCRLEKMLAPYMEQAHAQQAATDKSARVFTEFMYQTVSGSWSQARRVIAKAEVLGDKENPRFVVTSLAGQEWDPRPLYEDLYCARGEMENRIKEQLSLFADRVSTETMRANQVRLYLSGMAYVLVSALRRIGLQGTEMARAQATTIRLRLLKIGAQVRITARRVWVQLAQSFPRQALFWRVAEQLRC